MNELIPLTPPSPEPGSDSPAIPDIYQQLSPDNITDAAYYAVGDSGVQYDTAAQQPKWDAYKNGDFRTTDQRWDDEHPRPKPESQSSFGTPRRIGSAAVFATIGSSIGSFR